MNFNTKYLICVVFILFIAVTSLVLPATAATKSKRKPKLYNGWCKSPADCGIGDLCVSGRCL
ncbi:hypothetical protein Ocin01_01247 [Orchesella cincta]|uniref:Uncharacterized protein n=1 Tax=Orchesella cincta TaxID=48709 RepID=A0A1D2NK00_ORCCI|nr:hypothetical protein Ocin01_01247 [Orchesella cincta]